MGIWALIAPAVVMFLWLRRSTLAHAGTAVCALASVAFGVGASSVLWWLLLHLPWRSRSAIVVVDICIWMAIGGLAVLVRRRSSAPRTPAVVRVSSTPRRAGAMVWSALLFAPAAACAAVLFSVSSVVMPHGEWDAWAIWNVRARMVFRAFPDEWREAFGTAAVHVDYPPLLPMAVARAWTYLGIDATWVPIVVAAMFAVSAVAIAGLSVTRERGGARGLFAATLVLATPAFIAWAPSQEADVPLAVYVLLTCVLLTAARARPEAVGLWAGAGVAAAFGAWTKNEGVAFGMLASLAIAYSVWRRVAPGDRARVLGVVAACVGPIVLALWAFKMSIASSNDLVGAQGMSRAVDMLTSRPRLEQVGAAFWAQLWKSGDAWIGVLPVAAIFVLIGGVDRSRLRLVWPSIGIVGAMLALDAVVYVLTPHDLTWHLRTSLMRVVLQLTPALIWAALYVSSTETQETGFLKKPGFLGS